MWGFGSSVGSVGRDSVWRSSDRSVSTARKARAGSSESYYEIIRQLTHGGALSEAEQRILLELGKRGFAVGSDREAEKFVAYAQGLHKRMLGNRSASPVALAIIGVIANYAIPSNLGRRGRVLARASQHPVRDILLGVAGGAIGGLRMSGWNPIGGVVGGVVGGAIAAVEALC